MKSIIILFVVTTFINAQENPGFCLYPTNRFPSNNENITQPNEILVVYRSPRSESDTMSLYIKNYYITKRNIPEINSIGIRLPLDTTIDNHLIELLYEGELIKDMNWQEATNHAWQYFMQFIFNPIQNYLDTTYINGQQLKNKIKYIVLCKGIPLKINPYFEDSRIGDYQRKAVSLDGLLCLLSQENQNFSILDDVFGTYFESLKNPYFNVDTISTGTYRFKSNYFGDANYKINYLVSRLDGMTYNDAIELIDRSAQPDMSGNNLFLLDAHNSNGLGVYALRSDAIKTESKLNSIGYNNLLDLTNYIYYSSTIPVIGYTSSGRHAGMPYWYNYLFTFEKPNGSVYNTYESFNGYYLDSLNLWNRQDNQGMLTEWLRVGGSGGLAHTYEPTTCSISKDSIFFPLYAIGYSIVDAAYQGMPYIAFRNIVVGDPLTTIAWGKQTLTQNLTLNDTNLVTGEIIIPAGKILTISSDAVINFKHLGSITVNGTLTIQPGAKMNFNSGKSITINGTFNSVGNTNQKIEFDFTSPTSGNGIIVSPDAVINISNAVIKNAQFGISLDRVEPTIQDCEFMNCTYGLFLNESNYEISTYEGTRIINNKFTNNNSGITLDNSSPLITGNEFTENSTSVQCLNNSNAYFGDYIEPGMNSFHDNLASDVYASYSSPTLGIDLGGGEYVGGYNSFENVQEYFVIAENSSIEAGLNWWGEAPPNENLFFTENGYIELRPWLENPLSAPQQQNTNNKFAVSSPTSVTLFDSTWSIRKKINHAYKLLTSDEKVAGRKILKDVINDHPDSALSFRAMGLFIHSCNMRTEKDTLKKFLQLLVNHQNQKEIHRYAVLRLAEMKRETFLTNVNKLIAANPNSEITDLLYYSKFNHYYFYEKNKSLAREVMDKMVEKFPFSLMTKTAKQLLEVHQSNKVAQNTITAKSEKEISISNFPNPFNPITTISYTIEKDGLVEMNVFNILGEKVAQLVNEELKAGSHTATFNASHLSSSVYFCTLKTDKHISTIKLLLMK